MPEIVAKIGPTSGLWFPNLPKVGSKIQMGRKSVVWALGENSHHVILARTYVSHKNGSEFYKFA